MLLEFYGLECPHCKNMEPLVGRLEKETDKKIEKYEVWHNEENARKLEGYDKGRCGGVPFFINTGSGKIICGESTYEELKLWSSEQ